MMEHHHSLGAFRAFPSHFIDPELIRRYRHDNIGRSPGLDISSGSSSSEGKDTPESTPMSKTNQYKKIMKPLLERKRRARINKCLDELKEIMTVALQSQGENVSKLEKADILELTVKHLHKMERAKKLLVSDPLEEVKRYRAGYASCAREATSFLLTVPGVDPGVSSRLMDHLNSSVDNYFPGAPRYPDSMSRFETDPVSKPPPRINSVIETPKHRARIFSDSESETDPDTSMVEVKKEPVSEEGVWRPF